jgi:hypothetical protein
LGGLDSWSLVFLAGRAHLSTVHFEDETAFFNPGLINDAEERA